MDGLHFLLLVINTILSVISPWTQILSANIGVLVQDGFITPLLLGAWIMVWWVWFRLQRPAWLPGAVAVLTLGFMVSTIIGENLLYPYISISVADIFHTVSLAVRLVLLIVLILVVYLGSSPPGRGGLAGTAGRRAADCFAVYHGAGPAAYKD